MEKQMTQAHITPTLARWARVRAGLSPNKVADQIGVKAERVQAWETGSDLPSMPQAMKLAHILRVPFGYFFLQSVPEIRLPLPDLRTLPESERDEIGSALIEVIHDAQRKQQWYQEWRKMQGEAGNPLVACVSMAMGAEAAAARISRDLNVDQGVRNAAHNADEMLRQLILRAEDTGILVLRSGIVGMDTHRPLSVREVRGFAMVDPWAPLVFLNSRDSVTARVFTLVHEITHIYLGASGVSNVSAEAGVDQRDQEVERFCNEVAAQVLMPQVEVVRHWDKTREASDNIALLAQTFHLSRLATIIRSQRLGLLDRASADQLSAIEKRAFQEHVQDKKERSGGDFYRSFVARNSERLVRSVLSESLEGKMLYRDAAHLLGVRVSTLFKVAKHLGVG